MGLFNEFESNKDTIDKYKELGLTEKEAEELVDELDEIISKDPSSDFVIKKTIDLAQLNNNLNDEFIETTLDYFSEGIGEHGDAAASLDVHDNIDNVKNVVKILDNAEYSNADIRKYAKDILFTSPENLLDTLSGMEKISDNDYENLLKNSSSLKRSEVADEERTGFNNLYSNKSNVVNYKNLLKNLGVSDDQILSGLNELTTDKGVDFANTVKYSKYYSNNMSISDFTSILTTMSNSNFEFNENFNDISTNKDKLTSICEFFNNKGYDSTELDTFMKDVLKGNMNANQYLNNLVTAASKDEAFMQNLNYKDYSQLKSLIDENEIDTSKVDFSGFDYKATDEEISTTRSSAVDIAVDIANDDTNVSRFGGGHGNDIEGYDCSGFINHVYQEAGINVPNALSDNMDVVYDDYGFNTYEYTNANDLKPGDIIITDHNSFMYIGNNQIVGSWGSKDDPYNSPIQSSSNTEEESISVKDFDDTKFNIEKIVRYDGEFELSGDYLSIENLSELAKTNPQKYIEEVQKSIENGEDILDKYSIKDINEALNNSGAEKDSFTNYMNSIPETLKEDVIKDLLPHAGFDFETQISNFFNKDNLEGYYTEEVMDDSLEEKITNYKEESETEKTDVTKSNDEIDRDD